MYKIVDELFLNLSKSKFRSSFKLKEKDIEYINKNYNTESKDIESIIDNKFDLGEFNEEKNKEKKLKKGE